VSRRQKAVKRTILPDARYDSQTVSKFINTLMLQGKKSTAEGIFYGAMDLVESRTGQPGVNVFKAALQNIKPVVEVKSRRVGGATYQVPVEVRPERRTALGMRWLMQYSRERSEKSMAEKLAAEVIAASKGEGNSVKKKDDTHRMADANKAFAHYRWQPARRARTMTLLEAALRAGFFFVPASVHGEPRRKLPPHLVSELRDRHRFPLTTARAGASLWRRRIGAVDASRR
jgi:small subunit ribosomal protein S7